MSFFIIGPLTIVSLFLMKSYLFCVKNMIEKCFDTSSVFTIFEALFLYTRLYSK